LDELRELITTSLNDALDNFDYIINHPHDEQIKSHNCPDNYRDAFAIEFRGVYNITRYVPDTLILLDCYYVGKRILKNKIGFVTTDKEHILSNVEEIQRELSDVHIFDMRNS
jgi:hypothetical protein